MGYQHTILLFLFVFICFGNAAERLVPKTVPRGWLPSGIHKRAVLEEQDIKVTVALSQRNLEQLESVFWTVSNPKNLDYGRYKSFQEIVDLVAPDQASIDLVTGYFQEKGVTRGQMALNPSKDFLALSLSVTQAEKIFKTTYESYVHSTTGNLGVRMTGSYFLDSRINSHIDFVSHFCKISGRNVAEYQHAEESFHTRFLGAEFTTDAARSEKAPRANATGNAPFVENPWADSTGVFLRILFFCPDGSAPAISGNPTSNSTTLSCGSVNITSLNVSLVSQITNNTLFTGSLSISRQKVSKCSDLNDTCLVVASYNNLAPDAAYLTVYLNSTINPPLPL